MTTKIALRKRLVDTELACQIAYSYDYITSTLEGWELNKAIANWKLEIYDYLIEAKREDISYILDYLNKEGSKAYFEVIILVTELEGEQKPEINLFQRFFGITKKRKTNEKIHVNSGVFIRKSSDGNRDSGYTNSSESVYGENE